MNQKDIKDIKDIEYIYNQLGGDDEYYFLKLPPLFY